MMTITNEGHKAIFDALVNVFKTIHLYTIDGELKGHGYTPKALSPAAWSLNGRYPEQTWTFEAGDRVQVLGYYLADGNGNVLLSDEFDLTDKDDFFIEHNGSKIRVNVEISVLGAEG